MCRPALHHYRRPTSCLERVGEAEHHEDLRNFVHCSRGSCLLVLHERIPLPFFGGRPPFSIAYERCFPEHHKPQQQRQTCGDAVRREGGRGRGARAYGSRLGTDVRGVRSGRQGSIGRRSGQEGGQETSSRGERPSRGDG